MQGDMDELEAQSAYIKEFPDTFKEAFDKVRNRAGYTLEQLSEKMNLEERQLRRWLKDPRLKHINEDFVTILTLILKLPDWISDLLYDRAHIRLSGSDPRHRAIRFIQRVLWMDGVEKANAFLSDKGFEPLTV